MSATASRFIHSKEVRQAIKLNRREDARQEFLAPEYWQDLERAINAQEDTERRMRDTEEESLRRR